MLAEYALVPSTLVPSTSEPHRTSCKTPFSSGRTVPGLEKSEQVYGGVLGPVLEPVGAAEDEGELGGGLAIDELETGGEELDELLVVAKSL